jgi:hypothetical protein
MEKNDAYAMLWLLNKEIRKSSKSLSFNNVFSPNAWPIAIDRMQDEIAFGASEKAHEINSNRCIKLANAVNCGQTNIDTVKVYLFGEYIRRNHGKFLKRKKDGSLYTPKGKKKKPVYNAIDYEELGKLSNIEFYKPENMKAQTEALRAEAEKHVSLLDLDENQRNILYDLVCDGTIGIHVYLHLWKKNKGFGIDLSKSKDEEYNKFIKMIQYLDSEAIDLQYIYFHDRA